MNPQTRSFIADVAERTGITTSELTDMFHKHGETRKPVKKFSGKGTRVGNLGTVRLKGAELEDLRRKCFDRDNWQCCECGVEIAWISGCLYQRGEMAHIRTKRNHGDTLENVKTLCHDCHAKSHNCNGKPCPPKVQP